jgi:hypothetical protein
MNRYTMQISRAFIITGWTVLRLLRSLVQEMTQLEAALWRMGKIPLVAEPHTPSVN